jgi:hypothetical protein
MGPLPRWRLTATGLVVLVVASPALRDRDSFPLSTYPVYASARSREMSIVTAVGIQSDGIERRLPMALIARTDDPLIAEQRLRDAVDTGEAGGLCRRIADAAPEGILTVLVVSERHDAVRRAAGEPSQLERIIEARCLVPG